MLSKDLQNSLNHFIITLHEVVKNYEKVLITKNIDNKFTAFLLNHLSPQDISDDLIKHNYIFI